MEKTEKSVQLKEGDNIKIILDWTKRYSYMQVHTCLHLLCSLIPYPVTGGSIGFKRGRLDFRFRPISTLNEMPVIQYGAE